MKSLAFIFSRKLWRISWAACGIALAATLGAADAPDKNLGTGIAALVQSGRPTGKAVAGVAKAAGESPHWTQTPDGYIEELGAVPGSEFPALAGPAGQPEVTAKNFLKQNAALFGVKDASVDFQLRKKNSGKGRHSIRLTQTYEGIPVFGGEALVQVNDGGGVEFVMANIDRETIKEKAFTKPKLTAAEAAAAAKAHYAAEAKGQALSTTPPALTLFVPGLLKIQGPRRLTWKLEVHGTDLTTVKYEVFIDAHSGEFVQDFPLIKDARVREIRNANYTNATVPGSVARAEGAGATGIADVDAAYTQLGQVYDYFHNEHGRDGIDNAGATMLATVNYRQSPPAAYQNAYWDGTRMIFGEGYVIDDVTGHELTHGITQNESNLTYANESGALNESFSDVFGEFVDLTNGTGTDTSGVRWLIAEELPGGTGIRNMANPPAFSDPDWLGSGSYVAPAGTPNLSNDYGGVHRNSGVNNKLCYLLTDGATFRGRTVIGMGIGAVSALYYEVNTNLLISSSGWRNLSGAMRQAAINLSWSAASRENLDQALAAVGAGVWVDFSFGGSSTGTFSNPYKTVADGVSNVPNYGVIIMKGPQNTTSTINIPSSKPLRLQSDGGTVRIGP
jgi:bacillolysin